MKEISVRFNLTDEDAKRLDRLRALYGGKSTQEFVKAATKELMTTLEHNPERLEREFGNLTI